MGDLERAEIYVLMLNPGFKPLDYKAESDNRFRQALVATLRQELEAQEFPFVCLDPQFAWTGGFSYWFGKLGDVVREIAKRRFNNKPRCALRFLATKLAVMQAFPYRSESFGAGGVVQKLPSFLKAKNFVHSSLATANGGKIFILLRGAELWSVSSRFPPAIVYDPAQARSASLSLESQGGEAIIDHLMRT
ncbi:hypothetical protein [Methyloceanibacter sp.]|uniref:hypothetical protein n=1 Tax=Methyloceanibacter sp. TaxID=1965321 RepID=UPI003D6CFE41